eukprot:1158504-Pelagomonas_calceolata.AAC.1
MHIQSRKLDGRERVPKTQLQAIPLSLVSFRGNDPQTCMHLAQNIVDCVNSYTEGVKACIHLHFLVAQSCKAIGVMMTVSIVELVVKNAIENDALKHGDHASSCLSLSTLSSIPIHSIASKLGEKKKLHSPCLTACKEESSLHSFVSKMGEEAVQKKCIEARRAASSLRTSGQGIAEKAIQFHLLVFFSFLALEFHLGDARIQQIGLGKGNF